MAKISSSHSGIFLPRARKESRTLPLTLVLANSKSQPPHNSFILKDSKDLPLLFASQISMTTPSLHTREWS